MYVIGHDHPVGIRRDKLLALFLRERVMEPNVNLCKGSQATVYFPGRGTINADQTEAVRWCSDRLGSPGSVNTSRPGTPLGTARQSCSFAGARQPISPPARSGSETPTTCLTLPCRCRRSESTLATEVQRRPGPRLPRRSLNRVQRYRLRVKTERTGARTGRRLCRRHAEQVAQPCHIGLRAISRMGVQKRDVDGDGETFSSGQRRRGTPDECGRRAAPAAAVDDPDTVRHDAARRIRQRDQRGTGRRIWRGHSQRSRPRRLRDTDVQSRGPPRAPLLFEPGDPDPEGGVTRANVQIG